MKITLDLPIHARATPKGTKSTVDVFCTTSYTADVPEIALVETDVAFEANHSFVRGSSVPMLRHYELRRYDGALYRKVADSLDAAERQELFTKPFDEVATGRLRGGYYNTVEWPADFGGDISPLRDVSGNKPIARPLTDEFEWRLDRESSKVLKSKTAWPKPEPRGLDFEKGWHTHRNAVRFESVHLRDVVPEDFEIAREMIRKQTGKLILIDNEIWMETRPPAYRLQYRPSYWRGPPIAIELCMTTAPEGYVGDLYTQYFCLADGDRAADAARQLMANKDDWNDFERNLKDFNVHFECDDDIAVYDYQQEDINRFGYTAAVECRNYLSRNPEHVEKLSESEIAGIEAAYSEVMEVNHVLEVHREMNDHLPILASAWKKLGCRQVLTGGYTVKANALAAEARAMRYLEEAPISLVLNPVVGFQPTGP